MVIQHIYTPGPQQQNPSSGGQIYHADVFVGCTLEELCEKVDVVLQLLRNRGFRRELPSRADIMKKMDEVLVESIDIRKEIKRIKLNLSEVRNVRQ